MKNKILILLFIFSIAFLKAQDNEYISLGKDKYGDSMFYKIDKNLENEFFFWLKVEYTMENDRGRSKTEYYVNAKCDNKTTALLKYANDWRKDDEDDKFYDFPKDKIEYVPTAKNGVTYFLFKKLCKK